MKKILIIIGSLNTGGTEKHLYNLIANGLNKHFKFHIITITETGDLYKRFLSLGVKVYNIGDSQIRIFKIFYKIYMIHKFFLKVNPDIVHYYLPHSYLLGGFLSIFYRKKKFIMSRRSLNFYQNKYFLAKQVEYFLHSFMDKIIVNSKKIIKQLVNEEGVENKKIKLIYNGILLKKKQTNKVSNTHNLVCLANFIKYKNHEMLFRACALLDKRIDWKLNLYGKSDVKRLKKLKQICKELKIIDKVNFNKSTTNVSNILSKSYLGLLVSLEEGFSNSILEYLNHGLPVIATQVGGNDEVIKNNYNGYLIEVYDDENLAKKIEYLLQNKKEYSRISKNSLLSIKKYDIYNAIKEYQKIYEEL